MKKVTATLYIEMYTKCPNCNECVDVFSMDHLNDEGQLSDLLKSRYYEDRDLWKNLDIDFTCPSCTCELKLDALEY